jgi:hypothetical protein
VKERWGREEIRRRKEEEIREKEGEKGDERWRRAEVGERACRNKWEREEGERTWENVYGKTNVPSL